MAQPMKYTHKELVDAVQRIQDLGDYDKEVEASRKAGEILNSALDSMEKDLVAGLIQVEDGVEQSVEDSDSFDNSGFKL